jgi:Pentapeptide repeats (8 copies)
MTTDRILEEPCEATSLMHGFEAERRGRPLRLDNHLDILKQGVKVWNTWREENPDIYPDLSNADLYRADLRGAFLGSAEPGGANLSGANLCNADLRRANLSATDLTDANLNEARLNRVNLSHANLSRANLAWTLLSEADLGGANLTECSVYAISAWNVQLKEANQSSLIISHDEEPLITVDNLEVAQFIYLLLNNQKIRDVIDTITSKVVLILGRFTPERERVLDALREELRNKDYLPIVFDFDVPTNRNVTETVTTLARLARFIIADLTDPKSIPQELAFIVPDLPSVPVQPLLQARSKEYGMFDHFKSFPWVLPVHRYTTVARLLATLREHVIEPAENRAKELALEKAKRLESP